MEKYCKSCGRVFKKSDFRTCPYCGNSLSTREGRKSIPRQLRHQVFQRDGYRCRECGATNKQARLHVDHIKPVAKGGTNDLSNLQTLCEDCNRAKYTDEWIGGLNISNEDDVNQRNDFKTDFKHNRNDYSNLFELNRKQREINLARHNEKIKNQNSNKKEFHNNTKSNNNKTSLKKILGNNTKSSNNDRNAVYYYNLGFQYRFSAQKEKAVKYFKKALEIDPNFITAFEQLGYTLEELGRYAEAIKCLEKVDYDYDWRVSQHIASCKFKLNEEKQ